MNPVETGFYYLQSRYYDPNVGRFINADEPSMLEFNSIFGDTIGSNLFAYANNNPVMNDDPSGYGVKVPSKSQVFIKSWKVYFTNSAVKACFVVAATTGPAAMMILLDTIATIFAGPIGTAVSLVLDIIGIATIINFCYFVLQAQYYNEGIYLGINWKGPFPSYAQGCWHYNKKGEIIRD